MANRVFQNVVYQMKDAIDRVVGVVDETGAVIACSELGQIGEMREGFAVARLTAGDAFEKDGYAYHQFSNAKHNDYAVFVEGNDPTAAQFASLLSISLQSIKQYHDEKFDKTNFIKNVVLDNITGQDIIQHHILDEIGFIKLFIVVLLDALQADGQQRSKLGGSGIVAFHKHSIIVMFCVGELVVGITVLFEGIPGRQAGDEQSLPAFRRSAPARSRR